MKIMSYEDPTSLENVIAGGLLADAFQSLKLQNQIVSSVDKELQRKKQELDNVIKHEIATLQPDLRKKVMEVIQNRYNHPEEYIKQRGSAVVTYSVETLQTLCYMILSYNEYTQENNDDLSM
jgi:hypothetical protein